MFQVLGILDTLNGFSIAFTFKVLMATIIMLLKVQMLKSKYCVEVMVIKCE
jgi:hypothetical protein